MCSVKSDPMYYFRAEAVHFQAAFPLKISKYFTDNEAKQGRLFTDLWLCL